MCEVGGSLADGGAALVIADIPGLVEGAHMVRPLFGFKFIACVNVCVNYYIMVLLLRFSHFRCCIMLLYIFLNNVD